MNSNFYRPYHIINGKHLKYLGDKLLYSTAFLVDHILKFHKSAFSWRNLELIPDIILANKDSSFRHFYADIMSFLSKQHLRKTVNAVFQYKFNSKIANEMTFLSKISESSAAAFNFTLDESYHLKSYYKKKLAAKYQEYNLIGNISSIEGYIHSIGYLHSIIGDIHYYDEEYDDAIIHYTDALQAMRGNSEELIPHQFILYTRNKLNLGLCLEKTRSYDRAYSIYRSLIIQLKDFDFKGRNKSVDPYNDWETPYKRMQLFLRPHVAMLNVIEKQRQDGITYDNLERNIREYLSYLEVSELNLFPLGQQDNPLDYDVLGSFTDEKDEVLRVDKKRLTSLITDYYFSVGGMLFYKNQIFYRLIYTPRCVDQISKDIRTGLKKRKNKYYHPSHSAYLYYLHAIISFNSPFHENVNTLLYDQGHQKLRPFNKENILKITEHIKFATNYLDQNAYKILNNKQYEVIANLFGKLGDTLLACLNAESANINACLPILELYAREEVDFEKKKVIFELENKLDISLVFALYRMAYLFFKEAGKDYSAVFQYKKVLYIIKDRLESANLIPTELLENIASIIMHAHISISGVSNRAELKKYRFYTEGAEAISPILYQNLSTATDIKEVIILVENIKLKRYENYHTSFKASPYSTISSMFLRMLELKLQGQIELTTIEKVMGENNYEGLLKHLIQEVQLRGKTSEDYKNLVRSTANAYYCFHTVIKILNTYGISYILNHSLVATMHKRMAIVCLYYNLVREAGKYSLKDGEERTDVEEAIRKLVGKHFKFNTDAFHHLDLAKLHYEKAILLHTEGHVYRDLNQEMYTLDDDFNDNFMHFCAASERFRMNTGRIEALIAEVNRELKLSNFYKYKYYAG